MKGTRAFPGLEPSSLPPKPKGVDPIEEMVGALCDPIIVFPSGWEDTLPERLKTLLPIHRLAHVNLCLVGKESWDEATDLEALLYLYPASLAAPMGEMWTKIYLYLGTKVMGEKFPEDIKEESLPNQYMGELQELKRWIQKKKVQARKERKHREKKEEEKTKLEPVKCEQLKFF